MTARLVLAWTLASLLLSSTHVFAQQPWPVPSGDTVVFTLPPLPLPPRLEARQLFLEQTFHALRESAKGRTWLLGGMIGISAGLIGFGAAYPRAVGAFLLPIGILGVARGVAGLTLLPDPRDAANQFLRLPAYSADAVRARLRFGEQALAAQARVDRRTRIADGVVSMTVAASYVPLAWYIAHKNDPSYRFRDNSYGYSLIALSVINAATSLVTALTETPLEERYGDYKKLVARQEAESPGELDKLVGERARPRKKASALAFSLAGTRRQLQLAASLRF